MTSPTSAPTPPASEGRPHGRRKLWIALTAIAAVVVLVGVGIWYFVFRDTAPERVNIESASESVDDKQSSGSSTGFDGTWTVDTSIGSFDPDTEDYTSAWVGYRVQEELAGIGAKTAFGRTPNVTGTLTIEGTDATEVEIEADLTTLQSDDGRRDGQLANQAIQTSQFPTATFTLTEPIDFGDVADGETVKVDAVGELTLHGVKREVTVPLDAKLEGETIVVTGSIDILFADYDIEKPTSVAVLSVEDQGVMELQLFFTKQ
jgi:polyisoprenoid-binding protein YceI